MSYSNAAPVILITGAARRIGAALTRALHAEGYRVLIHYRASAFDAEHLCEQLNLQRPDSAFCMQADLSDLASVQLLAEKSQKHWGRLDVLINNASSFYPTPVGEIHETDWDDLFASNAKAPLFLSQALAPALAQQQGCIVNIADIHAFKALKTYTVYCMAKAANVMMTQSMARELAPGIRVNGIAPGCIIWPEQDEQMDDTVRRDVLERISLKRMGDVSDITRTALFLIAQAPYITGQIIAVDGGRSLSY